MNVGVGGTLFNLPAPSQQQNDKACRSCLEKPQQSQGMGGSRRWGWGVGLAKHHRREEEEQEERDRGMQTRGGTARVGGHPGAESVAGGRRSEPPGRPCRWHEPHRPLSPPQRDFAFQFQASAAARKAPLAGSPGFSHLTEQLTAPRPPRLGRQLRETHMRRPVLKDAAP